MKLHWAKMQGEHTVLPHTTASRHRTHADAQVLLLLLLLVVVVVVVMGRCLTANNMFMHLKDGSAQTIVRVTTVADQTFYLTRLQ